VSRGVTVVAAVAVAVVANLLVFAAGRAAGGDFTFMRSGSAVTVDAMTVAGFSAVPLGAGLALVAALVGRVRWIATIAAIVAPLLAVVTIFVMTIPVDLDRASTVSLACCHLTLVPISLLAIRRIQAA
jgi:hypothetical protein